MKFALLFVSIVTSVLLTWILCEADSSATHSQQSSIVVMKPDTRRGILYDFTANWCAPCRRMKPIVTRMEQQGLPIRQVDVDREPALAKKYGISSIPAFVLVIDGKVVQRVVGMTSESQLRNMIAKIPPVQQSEVIAKNTSPHASQPTAPTTSPAPRRPLPVTHELSPKQQDGPPAHLRPEAMIAAAVPSGPKAKPGSGDLIARAKFDFEEEPVAKNAGDISGKLLNGCVRIRVQDKEGVNFGSGTVIASKTGNTLILTCGHIFRNLDDKSKIEVDVFSHSRLNRRATFVGKVLHFNLEADVGLLSIPTDRALHILPVAGLNTPIKPGQMVSSVGCGGGENPSRQIHRITALNRYLGPDNIECTGVPVQGRSGGGLYDEEGRTIGVCIAADPEEKRGLYAGLVAIHQLLDQAELSALYRKHDVLPGPFDGEPTELISENKMTPFQNSESQPHSSQTAPPMPGVTPRSSSDTTRFTDESQLAGLLNNASDSEVICIIRPRNRSKTDSRVVIVNRASERFVNYLTGELKRQPHLTTVVKRHSNAMTDTQTRNATRDRLSGWSVTETFSDIDTTTTSQTTMTMPVTNSQATPLPAPTRYRRSASIR